MATVLLHMLIHEAEQGTGGLFVHGIDVLLAIFSHLHELAKLQALKVVRNSRLFLTALLGEFFHTHRFLKQQQHELDPFGVAERLEKFLVGGRKHSEWKIDN